MEKKLRIKLKSYDQMFLEIAVQKILKLLNEKNSSFLGPIPLPVKRTKYTVNRSPHVNKESREQFLEKKHTRIIDIYTNEKDAIKAFDAMDLSSAVELKIVV